MPSPLAEPAIVSLLQTAYSPDQAAAIRSYLDDFDVFSDGFLPIVATIAENGGVKLLLVRCPLALDYLPGTSGPGATASPAALGVLFTPHFPGKPPVCAVLLDAASGLELPANVPWLAPGSGSVKLPLLPELELPTGGASPALIDLLLAVTTALTQHRVAPRQSGVSPTTPSPAAPSPPAPMASGGHQPGSPVPPTSGGSAGGGPSPTTQGSVSSPSHHQQMKIPLAAEIAVRDALAASVAEFITHYDAAERRLAELRESKATLEHLGRSLGDKSATLRAAAAKLEQAERALKRAKEAQATVEGPMEALVPPDALRAQAVDLLAEVLAYDDLLEVYERRLRKGTISGAAAYTRLVGDAARHQFLAKYKLKKVHGAATAKQSFQSLVQRFPGADPGDVASVLAECRFSLPEAAKHLTEMSQFV